MTRADADAGPEAELATDGTDEDADAGADGDADAGTDQPTKVAIACQGGGSHTAFTAGLLRTLLREWDDDRYELVGISGTSGGAFNALAVWYGLVTADADAAADLLESLWADLTASDPADRWTNTAAVASSRIQTSGVPTPQVSPYFLPGAWYGQQRIKGILERHVDFDRVPDLCTRAAPELVVGTVDVEGGVFETFVDEEVTAEAVLASAAVPDLFRGVRIGGHLHWDGLFSQNPPVMDLLTVDADRKPEELWVLQINPQERESEPKTLSAIADRRNELSGNLSLNQELRFVHWVNEWIDAGHLPRSQYSRVTVRRIEMGKRYDYPTKLDRSERFVRELMDLGETRAREFLDGLEEDRRTAGEGTGDDGRSTADHSGISVHSTRHHRRAQGDGAGRRDAGESDERTGEGPAGDRRATDDRAGDGDGATDDRAGGGDGASDEGSPSDAETG